MTEARTAAEAPPTPPFVRLTDRVYNVDELRAALDVVVERAGIGTASRGADSLRGISLTHRGGARDPWHDGNNSQFDRATGARLYQESDFSVFAEAAEDTYFREVYETVPFGVGRMRLLFLPPMTIYKMHRDSARRAHLAIVTNEDCRLTLRTGETLHVPADGHVHIADTRQPHTAYNAGDELRVHLVISVLEGIG